MSVADETELCNLALGRIGANRLADYDADDTVQAIQCRLHYPNLRDALLRSHDWGFAKTTLELVNDWVTDTTYTTDQYVWTNSLLYKCAVAHTSGVFATDLAAVKWVLYSTRPSGSGYDYQYVHPAAYLRLTGYDADCPHYSNQRGYILSDNTSIVIDYIQQITDVTDFTDPLFIEVLVLQLALRLLSALGLQMSGAAREQLMTELRAAEKLARVIDRQENNDTGQSAWNDARFGIYRD